MGNVKIQISEKEFTGVLRAYQTLQTFFEKIFTANELYQTDFLKGLQEAQDDVEAGRFEEVDSFDDFIR